MSEPHAFFEPQPDGSVMATPWARGPWDVNAQHGGPPSALLARALEQLLGDANADWLPARTNIEIRKPVPIDVLTAVATIDKQGKSVLRASAVLQHRDVTVAQAQFLMLRRLPSDATLVAEIAERLPPPDDFTPFAFPFFRHEIGYHRAMEVRLGHAWPSTRGRGWARMRCPLVAGESPSGWQRALCFADAAHGVTSALDAHHHALINPDLELSLLRMPEGEWIGLDTVTQSGAHGIGITRSQLHDSTGIVGATSATLVVRPRS